MQATPGQVVHLENIVAKIKFPIWTKEEEYLIRTYEPLLKTDYAFYKEQICYHQEAMVQQIQIIANSYLDKINYKGNRALFFSALQSVKYGSVNGQGKLLPEIIKLVSKRLALVEHLKRPIIDLTHVDDWSDALPLDNKTPSDEYFGIQNYDIMLPWPAGDDYRFLDK